MLRRLRSPQAPLTIALLVAALCLMPLAGQAVANAQTILAPCDTLVAAADVGQTPANAVRASSIPSDPNDPAVHGSRPVGHCSVSMTVMLLPDAQSIFFNGTDINPLPGCAPPLSGRASSPAFKPPRHG